MYLTGIRIVNFMPFRGEYELDLGPKLYAITARHEQDSRRSNWFGKTSIVDAIRFGLTGKLPTPTKDGAIHHGQDHVSVDLEFDDGTYIERTKRRGKGTDLVLHVDFDGQRTMSGDEAQEVIYSIIGFSDEDLLMSSLMEQGQMDRFVSVQPAERTKIFNDWLDMEFLVDGHTHAMSMLNELCAEDSDLMSRLTDLRIGWKEGGNEDVDALLTDLHARHKCIQKSLSSELEAYEETKRRIEEQVEWRSKLMDWEAYRRLAVEEDANLQEQDEIREERKKKKATPAQLSKKYEVEGQLLAALTAECRALEKTARGEFDGACPVSPGFKCPVTSKINSKTKANRESLREKKREREEQKKVTDDLSERIAWFNTADRQIERLEAVRLEKAKQKKRHSAGHDYIDKHGKPPELEETPLAPDRSELVAIEEAIQEVEREKILAEEIKQRREELRPQIDVWRAAAQCFRLAQQRVFEQSIGVIEALANERLTRSGIDLSLKLQWGRETGQPEDTCSRCGAAYPKSRKVKECPRCGNGRGLKVDQKIYLLPSATSGGAKDLAGVAFQLAAARWLRERRGSPWSVIVLDEPFGKLDEANRTALASSLSRMLEDGFEQGFIIAHDQGLLDAMPGRIEVLRHDEEWSEVKCLG